MGTLFTILMALGCMDSPTEPHTALTSTGSNTPGQVIDLVVTDSTGTTATLSFTQVDDGTGNPAAYAVRSHVGPMNWGAADEVTQGTCAAPLQGTAVGSTMSCTIEGLSPDVAYTFQVAAFRGTFQAGAVYGELSNVVPDMGDEPTQSPPSDASRPNEPTGYAVIASTPFTTMPDGTTGMDEGSADNYDPASRLSIVSDGDSNVFRQILPEGQQAGTGGATVDYWDGTNTQYDEIYQSMHIRLVSGPDDGTYEFYSGGNKLGFWGYQVPGGVPSDFYLTATPATEGAGTGQLEDHAGLQFRQQNNVNRVEWASADIQVGTWHHWEFQFVLNNPSNNVGIYPNGPTGDGIFRWWQDGVLILERTDVAFATDGSHGFFTYRWNPTWGGGAGHDARTRTDYIDIDNLYVSGVPK